MAFTILTMLGETCALRSILCRELGDVARADELAAKALTYGFEIGG